MSHLDDTAFQEGLAYVARADWSAAIGAFEDAATRFPDVPEVRYELGLAYQRRAEASIPGVLRRNAVTSSAAGITETLADAAGAFLGFAAVSVSRALGQTQWIVRYREDFRKSVEQLRNAIKLDDGLAGAHYALANSLRHLGQTDAAADEAWRAAELAPDDVQISARAQALDVEANAQVSSVQLTLNWDEVVLPTHTKRELRQMQLLLENPSLARDLGIDPPTGLLLHGPPGTGKTTIARVLASEARCHFYAATPAEINSMWLGESEKQVARLFAQARANAPSIVFLDEIDALLPARTGGINQYSDKVVNQFLHEMDGLTRNRRVFVVGATNRRDMLDPALLRGGRLSREIEIPLPDYIGRRSLFGLTTRGAKLADDVDFDELAGLTAGFSGANIKAVVNDAGLQALVRLSTGAGSAERHLTREDFLGALRNFQRPAPSPRPFWPLSDNDSG
ncbi:MAG: ATP-binding protein [Capsulimonadaceae bacterium]|nr:ATP-binding protein [Capsulimonadaceae bacterium]